MTRFKTLLGVAVVIVLLVTPYSAGKAQTPQAADAKKELLTPEEAAELDRIINGVRKFNQTARNLSPSAWPEIARLLAASEPLMKKSEARSYFRNNDDLSVIRTLAELTNVKDRGVRWSSTLLLHSVVDHTTICAVLDQLLQPSTSDDARVNLLGVVNTLAVTGAYKDNREWIEETFGVLKSRLSSRSDVEQTNTLMNTDIPNALETTKNQKVALGRVARKDLEQCRELSHFGKLVNK